MDKKSWIILVIIAVIVVLVILFWDKLIIKSEEIISADYCEEDSDCVLAVNPNTCCTQPIPVNTRVVELDGDYQIYEEGVDYSSYVRNNEVCSRIDCSDYPQISANVSLRCINNKCVIQSP